MRHGLKKIAALVCVIAIAVSVLCMPGALAYTEYVTASDAVKNLEAWTGTSGYSGLYVLWASRAWEKMGFKAVYGLGTANLYWSSLKTQGRAHVTTNVNDVPVGADVFFVFKGDALAKYDPFDYGQMGIYLGNGRFIHAGDKITVSSFWGDPTYGNLYGQYFAGWAWHDNVTVKEQTVSVSLDLNWRLDGADYDSSQAFATADVYINGARVANDVQDYYKTDLTVGSSYEIKDIRAKTGYTYLGVVQGSISGKLYTDTSVRLAFKTNSSDSGGSDSTYYGLVVMGYDNVPVRAYADKNSSLMGYMKIGETLRYLGTTTTDSRGVKWHSVRYNGIACWVSGNMASVREGAYKHSYGDVVTIINGNTNVRQQPSLSGKLLGVAYRSSSWTYLGEHSVDERDVEWLKINYNGTPAWISLKYTQFSGSSTPPSGNTLNAKTGTVTQSAYLVDNNPVVDGEKAFDGDSSTCWCVSEYAWSYGQWVQIQGYKNYTFTGFTIVNGYDKIRNGKDYWQLNSRVQLLDVYCDGTFVGRYNLKDTRSPQSVSFGKSVTGKTFRFVIIGAYVADKYDDVCISEITLW